MWAIYNIPVEQCINSYIRACWATRDIKKALLDAKLSHYPP